MVKYQVCGTMMGMKSKTKEGAVIKETTRLKDMLMQITDMGLKSKN
jgi:hypothetical protein